MKEDKYEIEGLAPDAFRLYVVQPRQPKKLICVASSEMFARVIIISLMEMDKQKEIDWNKP